MSEAPNSAEDLDLTGVPMDEPDVDEAAEVVEVEDPASPGTVAGTGENKPEAVAKDATAKDGEVREPLPADEMERRFAQTKTALAAERGRRRETERQLREALASRDVAPRLATTRRTDPDAEIDPEADPLGALKQMRAKIAAYETAAALDEQTDAQRQAREAQIGRVEDAFQEHEADFRDEHPDYDDAAKHYAVSRAQELMKFGLDPAKIQPMLREEFANLAATAIRARKNPAAVVYELAKGRGYGAAAAEPAKVIADPVKEVKDTGKLADLVRGQRATSPLSSAGGRAPAELDAATIGNISIRSKEGKDAFEKAFDKLEQQAKAAGR